MTKSENGSSFSVLLFAAAFFAAALAAPFASAVSTTYYAKTTVYFFISSDASFTVGVPNTGASGYNFSIISGTTEGGATAINGSTGFISFNVTSVPTSNLEPCVQGLSTNCQVQANNVPIFRIDNNGNVNEAFTIYAGAAMPTGLNISVNATCEPLTGCGTVLSGKANISTTPVSLATAVGTSQFLNITLWGQIGTLSGQSAAITLYINSSAQ